MKSKVLKNLPLFFFFSCLTFSLFFLISGCQKDEVDPEVQKIEVLNNVEDTKVTPRSATLDIIFYRTSLTTDNYLVGGQRTYQIFNKTKVKEIKFIATTQPPINVAGVTLKHYNIQVIFKDLTTKQFTAFSRSSLNTFTFTPSGNNLLTDTHSAKFIELTQVGSGNGYVYHFWRDVTIAPKTWSIKKDDGPTISTQVIEPTDKNSNIFSPQHIH